MKSKFNDSIGKQIRISVTKSVKVFLTTFFILISLLVLVSAIPNNWIEKHQKEALIILESEGVYPRHFFISEAAKQDNYTDKIIIQHSINDERDSVIEASMHKDYARYWHGYSIYIRPLLTFFNLYQIRYIFMITYISLFAFAAILIGKHTNVLYATAFVISVSMTYMIVVATSLHYLPMFFISFIAIIVQLLFPSLTDRESFLFFMVLGMTTSFIDFFTIPIVSLGLPLIVYIIRLGFDTEEKRPLKPIIINSLLWGIGYGCTWAAKWLIGSVILHENVLKDAANSISFRTMGNDEYAGNLLVDRITAIRTNFETMFLSEGKHTAAIMVLVLIMLAIIAIVHFTQNRNKKSQAIGIMIVGAYPYLWYFILSNHSIIHSWFTYRAQVITIFAVLSCIISLTEWSEL